LSASPQDLMIARLFFNAAFPVMQVLLDDDPKLGKAFANLAATVQFGAKNNDELVACTLKIDHGKITILQSPSEDHDLALTFPTVEKMNALLRGGIAMPRIKGNLILLPKVLKLLMGLMIMSPKKRPKEYNKQKLKVKCSLFMITRALSVYNKLGDADMREWCTRQPDRIYQFSVEPYPETGIACYLRVKAGNSKSGRGIYTRRSPFVHFHFLSVEGAMKVLQKDVAFVEAVEQGYVETIGSPEYACQLNDFMAILQSMLT
jgi:hypothetical protein